MSTTADILLKTAINVQPERVYELQAAPARKFGLLILELICKRLLLPSYECLDFSPETDGCDVVLTSCFQPPFYPHACIESKYVENFWIKPGTLLQQVKDAARKLRRVETHDVAHRFLLVSSLALKKRARANNKIFKHAHHYVIVVLLMPSKVVEENPSHATQEMIAQAKELTKEESLEAVSNISVVMLNDKFAEFEDQVAIHFEKLENEQEHIKKNQRLLQKNQQTFQKKLHELDLKQQEIRQEQQVIRQEQQVIRQEQQEIRQEQQVIRQEQQVIRQEQQLLRKGQQELKEDVSELKALLTNFLKRLTAEAEEE